MLYFSFLWKSLSLWNDSYNTIYIFVVLFEEEFKISATTQPSVTKQIVDSYCQVPPSTSSYTCAGSILSHKQSFNNWLPTNKEKRRGGGRIYNFPRKFQAQILTVASIHLLLCLNHCFNYGWKRDICLMFCFSNFSLWHWDLLLLLFYLWPYCMAWWGILFPHQGWNPCSLQWKLKSPNHWTPREVPQVSFSSLKSSTLTALQSG